MSRKKAGKPAPVGPPAAKVRARLDSMKPSGEKGVALSFSVRFGEGRSGAVRPDFDPWTAVLEPLEALAHHDSPEVAQWAATRAVIANRAAIETGGPALLDAVATIARHGLVMPDWLAELFVERYLRFQRKEVATLDEAFGHHPPDGRTLAAAQRHRRLLPLVAELAWNAINASPARPLDRGFFEEIAEALVARGHVKSISGSQVDKLYRDGVQEGEQDLAEFKKLMRRKTSSE